MAGDEHHGAGVARLRQRARADHCVTNGNPVWYWRRPINRPARKGRGGARGVRKMSRMARVLVVDDDEEFRHTMRLLLEDAEHEVLEVATGADALRHLRQPRTLVVLLDLLMPGIDGVEVLRRVAADPDLAARHTYIVVTADSWTFLRAAQPLVEAVGAAVIQRPFDVDTLLAAVGQTAEAQG